MNRWDVEIVLEALKGDSIHWALNDQELEQLRSDIRAGELGRAHIRQVVPLSQVGLVALAA